MTAPDLIYYLTASVLLTLAPGPDNTFVVAQGISRGRRAAILTALGMCSGVSVHTTAAALGISAMLYSSATAFMVLKYAGAAYLIYLAWKAITEHGAVALKPVDGNSSGWLLFRRGFIMNVINPKVGIFFLAFLPQFVSPGSGSIAGQMLLLGFLFMAQAVIIFCIIGFLAGSVGDLLLKRPRISRIFSWVSAGIFALLGLRLAFAER